VMVDIRRGGLWQLIGLVAMIRKAHEGVEEGEDCDC